MTLTAAEIAMSQQLMSYWGNFFATGNPNTGPNSLPNLLNWPVHDASTLAMMQFLLPSNNIINGLLDDTCDYFDKIGYMHGEGLLQRLRKTPTKPA